MITLITTYVSVRLTVYQAISHVLPFAWCVERCGFILLIQQPTRKLFDDQFGPKKWLPNIFFATMQIYTDLLIWDEIMLVPIARVSMVPLVSCAGLRPVEQIQRGCSPHDALHVRGETKKYEDATPGVKFLVFPRTIRLNTEFFSLYSLLYI